jgi:hypothetical protein
MAALWCFLTTVRDRSSQTGHIETRDNRNVTGAFSPPIVSFGRHGDPAWVNSATSARAGFGAADIM